MSQRKLRVIPLGGLGEIGKNMMVLEYGDDMIAVDVGVMFPEEDMLGVDLVIPDFSYVLERKEKFRGIAITHGHEDHIGALPYLLSQVDVPVYASRLSNGLVRVKLRQHRGLKNVQVNEVRPGDIVEMGAFSVEFFHVCHSIPDAMGLAIRTPVGTVIHTGDFKFDHTPVDAKASDLGKLASFGSEGVVLLLSDSTYAEIPGFTPSEQVVGETLDRVVGDAKGRVIVTTFASLISRVQQIIHAAVKHNRKVAVVGRSMVDNVQMATKLGYLKYPPGTIVRINEMNAMRPERSVIITTGSQGEPTSALVRMANNDHREVSIMQGDTVVLSSTPIPGNEALVYKTINNLMRLGADVLDHKRMQVHVHGHAAQEELKTMLSLIRPKYFVPVHGEYRHLKMHADIARSMGVAKENTFIMEDGDVLELTKKGANRAERVSAGPIYVDGLGRWGTSSVVLRDRKTLSRDGIVVAILKVDSRSSRIIGEPNLIDYGAFDTDEAQGILDEGKALLIEAFRGANGQKTELSYVHDKVKETLRQHIFKATKRRPMILPVAVEL